MRVFAFFALVADEDVRHPAPRRARSPKRSFGRDTASGGASILPGEKFADEIEAVIRSSKATVVLWSRLSVDSDWVKAEAREAKALGTLMPVLVERIEPPFIFRDLHSIDLCAWEGEIESDCLAALLAALKRKIGSPARKDSLPAISDALDAYAVEVEYWRSITATQPADISEYESYLWRFGDRGQFSELARLRIAALSGPTGPAHEQSGEQVPLRRGGGQLTLGAKETRRWLVERSFRRSPHGYLTAQRKHCAGLGASLLLRKPRSRPS